MRPQTRINIRRSWLTLLRSLPRSHPATLFLWVVHLRELHHLHSDLRIDSWSTEHGHYPYSQTSSSSTESSTSIVPESAPLRLTDGSFTPLAAIVIGILVLLTVYVILKPRTAHGPKHATLSRFVKALTSCIKCGAELPPASEFCNKSGTKQSWFFRHVSSISKNSERKTLAGTSYFLLSHLMFSVFWFVLIAFSDAYRFIVQSFHFFARAQWKSRVCVSI